MHVLIIKTSSLGDVIHTLPALTDAQKNIPAISFDWVVEPVFSEIPRFHPAVKNIIPVALRKWRRNILKSFKNREWQNFYGLLREKKYDAVIDAQGLVKSGFLTFLSRGIKYGYDKYSAWEPLACLAYDKKFSVNPHQHAIKRIRQLFSYALNYPLPQETPDYGIQLFHPITSRKPYCMFLHGTTREDKCWPEFRWQELIKLFKDKNIQILLPWGNNIEKQRAEKLAAGYDYCEVLPKSSLTELAYLLSYSHFNIAVDTGLGHLSAALKAKTISLYGPTDPALIGTVGKHVTHIKAKSMAEIRAEQLYFLIYH